jgi:hypothetical protein
MTTSETTRPLTGTDLVGALMALRSMIAEHCRRVDAGDPVLWAGLGDLLDLCAQHCYERGDQEPHNLRPVQ